MLSAIGVVGVSTHANRSCPSIQLKLFEKQTFANVLCFGESALHDFGGCGFLPAFGSTIGIHPRFCAPYRAAPQTMPRHRPSVDLLSTVSKRLLRISVAACIAEKARPNAPIDCTSFGNPKRWATRYEPAAKTTPMRPANAKMAPGFQLPAKSESPCRKPLTAPMRKSTPMSPMYPRSVCFRVGVGVEAEMCGAPAELAVGSVICEISDDKSCGGKWDGKTGVICKVRITLRMQLETFGRLNWLGLETGQSKLTVFAGHYFVTSDVRSVSESMAFKKSSSLAANVPDGHVNRATTTSVFRGIATQC